MTGIVDASPRADVKFERLAPLPPRYPKPWFPMLPVLGRMGRATEHFEPGSRFLAADTVFTSSGSSAICLALRSAGIGAGDTVAIPAYHCPTMIFPVLALGATPVLVPVNDRLDIDPAALDDCDAGRPRAVLLPHFFGIRQSHVEEIRRWCDARGAVLIEDCAHAFYGEAGAFVPGHAGHFAIASTRKFFAGTEGGALVSNVGALDVALPPARVGEELRSIVDTLHLASRAGNLPWSSRAVKHKSTGEFDGPADARASQFEAIPRAASAAEIASGVARRRALRSAVTLVRSADHVRCAAVRRARYRRWSEAVSAARGVRALHADIPDSGVPYVFPAVLERPERQFERLKYAGVQVWRWDQLARSGCETSRRLAIELVQLPCQQSVDDDAFEALVRAFADAVDRTG